MDIKRIPITDRQERIRGFRQELIDKARVGVNGAGRTANEVLKNLALVGFRNVFIIDQDHISDTNLPGTCLFTARDIGDSKAKLAADGFCRLSVAETPAVDYMNADICTELGEGVLNQYDIIINCVDNLETRLYVARVAKLLGKPLIDTGIDGFDWTVFSASGDTDSCCYACTMTDEQEAIALNRVRNSCDVTLKKASEEGHAATIITSAAQVGAIAVELAIKVLHHQEEPQRKEYDPAFGRMTIYNSASFSLRGFRFLRREDCENHVSYAQFGGVTKSPLSAKNTTLKELLEWTREHYGEGFYLSLIKDTAKVCNRGFVTTARCKHCRRPINVYCPQYTLKDEDMLCDECASVGLQPHFPSEAVVEYNFDFNSEPKVLDMTLHELGIPLLHIIELDSEDENKMPLFLELDGDMAEVLPNLTESIS